MGKCPTDTIKDRVLVLNTRELALSCSRSRHLLARFGEQIDGGGCPLSGRSNLALLQIPRSGALFIVFIDAKDDGFSGLLKLKPTECPRRLLE